VKSERIACIIPIYNGKAEMVRLLDSLQTQTAQFDTFIVDSSSKDGTQEMASARVAGWKVAYAGNAQCRHSHSYTIIEEFERYFDMGVFHAREPWIRQHFGGAGGEGMRYVKSELQFLGLQRIYLWSAAILRNAVKLLGYKLG
jgi:hypothetical protein